MKTIYLFFLRLTLRLSNFLYKPISFLAIKVEGGIHPKHRLLGYHAFFTDHIAPTDTVLDIGCGNGALSYDVARKARSVVGIDIEEKNIQKARKLHTRENLTYIVG